jgi:putative membrane protein
MGALYGLTANPQSLPAAAPAGVAFGLGVWAGSYLGVLPAAGLYRSAADEPTERNAMMVAAHVVWGASLGLIAHQLLSRKKQPPRRAARYGRRVRRAVPAAEQSA